MFVEYKNYILTKYIIKYILQIRNHNWINIFNDILIQAMVSDFLLLKISNICYTKLWYCVCTAYEG